MSRPSSSKRGYDSRWREFSRQFLREHPACAKCGAPSSDVHHVIDFHELPLLKFETGNLEALCDSCHARITRGTYQSREDRFEELFEALKA
jgi:5-methylcytosine-specific restriction protein A